MTAAARRHSKRVGYIRVSTLDQNTERQLDGQELDKIFTDKASGKDTKRPQLQAALDYLRGRRPSPGAFDGQAGPQPGRSEANCSGADHQGGHGRIR